VGEQSDLARELEAARATIASQAMRIQALEAEAQQKSGIDALRDVLQLSDIVGATVGQAPYRSLLSGIVEAARRIFHAGAASILLLDHETDELVFTAATGGGDNVLGMRFPAHQGIAGWVVMTGEAIAVGDVRRDPRWAKDFAQSTGYVPNSIMAAPLLVGDEIEGVLEVLDKASADTFGLDDMELLGLFARPAAIAVEQARMVTSIGTFLVKELVRVAEESGERQLAQAATSALEEGGDAADGTLQLARLVYNLGRRGDRARQLATEVLTSVTRYAR
jgi:GAF domain-containing protein